MTRSHYDQTVGPLGLPEVLDFKASLVHARNILLVEKCERLATVWYYEYLGTIIYEKVHLMDYFVTYAHEDNPEPFIREIYDAHDEYFIIEDFEIEDGWVRIYLTDELGLHIGNFSYDFAEFSRQFINALIRNMPDGLGHETHILKTRLLGEPDNKPER